MLLAIDIGNTHLVAGIFDGEVLSAHWRLSTQRERTSDELAAFLQVAFDSHRLHFSQISGVAISSVVPSLTPQAALLARQYFHLEPLVVGKDTKTGLINEYDNPAEVGADRLVNALAAWHKYSGACIIADFGTATTVDAVSSDGRYLGGAIAPGLQISTDALFQAAARLPRVELAPPPNGSTLATNTAASMQAGIVYGYGGLVRELVTRCIVEVREKERLLAEARGDGKPGEIFVIATGGLAELIAPLVTEIRSVEPNLTLDGLRLLWNQSQQGN